MLKAASEADALEDLHSLGCTDGLPVVVPTIERVERMVLASGMDAGLVLGEMGPAGGVATIEKVAVAAVMAGCLPDYMPVVVAAVRAVVDPRFDATEMQATTHCTAPLIIVNGPARQDCGPIAHSYGALGPGHRANASIGRALRLAMINIGGGRPGSSDMALLGHPGKFTYCLAESEEASPFEPLHQALGCDAGSSAVTVVGAEAPHSVLFSGDADAPDAPDKLLEVLAGALVHLGANNAVLGGGAAVVVLNPDHAGLLGRANFTREQVQLRLQELTRRDHAELMEYAQSFAQRRPVAEGKVSAFVQPADILVLVAGGSGLYSMVMPSWCAGPHKNRFVTVPVETNQFCEIPGAV